VIVSWRLLGTDSETVAFNVYRSADGQSPVRLNAAPLKNPTCWVDGTAGRAETNAYSVRPVNKGKELEVSAAFRAAGQRSGAAVSVHPAPTPAGHHANDISPATSTGTAITAVVIHIGGARAGQRPAAVSPSAQAPAYQARRHLLWTINLG